MATDFRETESANLSTKPGQAQSIQKKLARVGPNGQRRVL